MAIKNVFFGFLLGLQEKLAIGSCQGFRPEGLLCQTHQLVAEFIICFSQSSPQEIWRRLFAETALLVFLAAAAGAGIISLHFEGSPLSQKTLRRQFALSVTKFFPLANLKMQWHNRCVQPWFSDGRSTSKMAEKG